MLAAYICILLDIKISLSFQQTPPVAIIKCHLIPFHVHCKLYLCKKKKEKTIPVLEVLCFVIYSGYRIP